MIHWEEDKFVSNMIKTWQLKKKNNKVTENVYIMHTCSTDKKKKKKKIFAKKVYSTFLLLSPASSFSNLIIFAHDYVNNWRRIEKRRKKPKWEEEKMKSHVENRWFIKRKEIHWMKVAMRCDAMRLYTMREVNRHRRFSFTNQKKTDNPSRFTNYLCIDFLSKTRLLMHLLH